MARAKRASGAVTAKMRSAKTIETVKTVIKTVTKTVTRTGN